MLINLVSQKLEIVFHYKMASEASEETSHTKGKTFTRQYLTKDTCRKHKVMQINFFKKNYKQTRGSNWPLKKKQQQQHPNDQET